MQMNGLISAVPVFPDANIFEIKVNTITSEIENPVSIAPPYVPATDQCTVSRKKINLGQVFVAVRRASVKVISRKILKFQFIS